MEVEKDKGTTPPDTPKKRKPSKKRYSKAELQKLKADALRKMREGSNGG